MCTGRENGRSRMKNRKKKIERETQGDSKRLEQLTKDSDRKDQGKGAQTETDREREMEQRETETGRDGERQRPGDRWTDRKR